MIHTRVELYGHLSDLISIGLQEITLQAGATVADAVRVLAEADVRIASAIGSCRFAVNDSYCGLEHALADGDVICLIPPVSGG